MSRDIHRSLAGVIVLQIGHKIMEVFSKYSAIQISWICLFWGLVILFGNPQLCVLHHCFSLTCLIISVIAHLSDQFSLLNSLGYITKPRLNLMNTSSFLEYGESIVEVDIIMLIRSHIYII